MTTIQPPPEARLIAELREAKVPPMSMREAAKRAGISASLWIQNERGQRKVAPGVTLPIRATPDKLARMAIIVGATPAQLTEAGRDDAARMMNRILAVGPDPDQRAIEVIRASPDFTEQQKEAMIEALGRGRAGGISAKSQVSQSGI